MLPFSELNDEIITNTDTSTTPGAAEERQHRVGGDERRSRDRPRSGIT